MKELAKDELKEVQMQIMDYVDSFCRKNSIQYTLSYGTLLGAVRHGGYIPWDDDIDIQLLRSEYDRFTQLWNTSKENHPYELVNIESGNNMGYPFGKIHDPKTTTYVGGVERTGVFIDVFPVDYIIDLEDYKLRSNTISRLYKKRYDCFAWMKSKYEDLSFFNLIRLYLRKPRLSYEEIAVKISNIAKQVSVKTDTVYDLINGRYSKSVIPSIIYEEYSDIIFEDRVYRSVKNYDALLTLTYGDWRTPPPEDKRVTHHEFVAFWKS